MINERRRDSEILPNHPKVRVVVVQAITRPLPLHTPHFFVLLHARHVWPGRQIGHLPVPLQFGHALSFTIPIFTPKVIVLDGLTGTPRSKINITIRTSLSSRSPFLTRSPLLKGAEPHHTFASWHQSKDSGAFDGLFKGVVGTDLFSACPGRRRRTLFTISVINVQRRCRILTS